MNKVSVLLVVSFFLLNACQNGGRAVESNENEQVVVPSVDSYEVISEENGTYEDYSDDRYNELLGTQPFALFFHASWCPTCAIVEQDILNNIEDLQAGVSILKVDFDNSAVLKKEYGVTSQSLVVVIDAEGNKKDVLVAPSFDTIRQSFASLL